MHFHVFIFPIISLFIVVADDERFLFIKNVHTAEKERTKIILFIFNIGGM